MPFRYYDRMRKEGLLILFCFLYAGISGCAGLHLYNAADHTQAQKAQSSFKDAKLNESISDERKRIEEIQQRQLAAVRRQSLAKLDSRLAAIIGATDAENSWGLLCNNINSRLRDLVGGQQEKIVELAGKQEAETERLIYMGTIYRLARSGGLDLVCVRGSNGEPTISSSSVPERVQVPFSFYLQTCRDLLKIETDIRRAGDPDTLWQKVNSDIDAIEAVRTAAQTIVKEKLKSYNEAKKDYKDAMRQSKPGEDSTQSEMLLKEIQTKLKAIGEVTTPDNLQSAEEVLGRAGANGLLIGGSIAQLEEQRKQLLTLIDKMGAAKDRTDLKAETTQDKIALTVAATLPVLERLTADQKFPPLNALLLKAERLRLEIEAAKRRQSHAQQALEILVMKRDAMAREVGYLSRASKALNVLIEQYKVTCKCCPCPDTHTPLLKPEDKSAKCSGPSLVQVITDKEMPDECRTKKDACKAQIGQVLRSYVSAWTLGRTPEELATFMIFGVDHEAILDESEIAFAQWNNLIGLPLDQLVAYYGSGIRSEDIGNLIQALGLGAIGYGVNR